MKRVTINIASLRSDGTLIPDDEREHAQGYVLRRFSRLFGGASAYEGTGAWADGDGHIVAERNTFVFSYADSIDERQLERIARTVKAALAQDSVMLAVDEGASVSFV